MSRSEDCVLDQYSLIGDQEGILINSFNGEMLINTTKPIESNSRQVAVTVGFQKIKSNPFMFEVYDCNRFV